MTGGAGQQRMCVVCRTARGKKELIRIVRLPTGDISVDLTGRAPGRGAYACRAVSCVDRLEQGKHLSRALRRNVSKDVYEQLREVVKSP